jgi:hypothetical protein
MKKAVILIFIFVLLFGLCTPAFSLTLTDYEPYSKEEFPKWSLDLRRAESLFFGGIPIAFPLTSAALSLAGQEPEFLTTFGIACAVSAAITLIDYIIGVVSAN